MAKDIRKFFSLKKWSGGGAETVSGAGSTLAYTEDLRPALARVFRELEIRSVVDAPCGDFNWMSRVDLEGIDYTGLDIVEEIIAANEEKYRAAGRTFAVADATKDALPAADMLICRDLLLHLPFRNIGDLLANVAKSRFDWVLITSYVNEKNSDILRPGLARQVNLCAAPFGFPRGAETLRIPDWVPGFPERHLVLYRMDAFRDCVAAMDRVGPGAAAKARRLGGGQVPPGRAVTRKAGGGAAARAVAFPEVMLPAGRHLPAEVRSLPAGELRKRLPATVLEYASTFADEGALLECVQASLRSFGFYTRHRPRYWEYPEILRRVERAAPRGPVVDLGAGVSPLPVLLADRGFRVITVDYSDTIRDLSRPENMNEWGFLDYAPLNPAIQSHNEDFATAPLPAGSVGLIYSVSVVEHMTAALRCRVVQRAADVLAPGGRLVLTIDLQPGSLALWNVDRRKPVEDPALHGDLNDFLVELRQAGFAVEEVQIRRALPGSVTDIAVLEAVRGG
ncbi:class I SAM-dependent methyltransferase [Tabrizicola sp. M-4]|uniref:class I SAM-dependent methyltransferase n=1 Tax=Tabrizicola sp. M-4 TaxID=3055847 RepID=UPI003DA80EA3